MHSTRYLLTALLILISSALLRAAAIVIGGDAYKINKITGQWDIAPSSATLPGGSTQYVSNPATSITLSGSSNPFIVFVGSPGISSPVYSQVKGPTVTTDLGDGSQSWGSPNLTQTEDGSLGGEFIPANSSGSHLRETGYGFSVPAGALITGIQVRIKRLGSTAADISNAPRMIRAGVPESFNHSGAAAWSGSLTSDIYGGSSDLWGASWSPADINSANFGVDIGARNTSGILNHISVDYVEITVYYALNTWKVDVSSPGSFGVSLSTPTGYDSRILVTPSSTTIVGGLQVNGNINATGFIGDGSGLTNLTLPGGSTQYIANTGVGGLFTINNSSPTTTNNGEFSFSNVSGPIAWIWAAGHRYRFTPTLDDPVLAPVLLLEDGSSLLLEDGTKLRTE